MSVPPPGYEPPRYPNPESSVPEPDAPGALTVGGVFTTTLRLWTSDFGRLTLVVILLLVPLQVLSYVLQIGSVPSGAVVRDGRFVLPAGETITTAPAAILEVLALLASLVANGAVCRLALSRYYGRDSSVASAIADAARRVGGLLLLEIAVLVLVGVGFVCLVVPGVFLGVMLAPALPVFIVEHTSAFGAIRRASKLVDGRWWATAGRLFVGIIFLFACELVFALLIGDPFRHPNSAAALYAPRFILVGVLGLVLTPLGICGLSVVYADLRAREGPLHFEQF